MYTVQEILPRDLSSHEFEEESLKLKEIHPDCNHLGPQKIWTYGV